MQHFCRFCDALLSDDGEEIAQNPYLHKAAPFGKVMLLYGNVESLACQSRRPHSHPNQHTEAELKLIRDMRRRNPHLGLVELWYRLKQRGYTRRPESLFRVMRKLEMFPQEEKEKAYTPKPYQKMTHPRERIQVDVKVVLRCCITDPELRLFQYTAIDE